MEKPLSPEISAARTGYWPDLRYIRTHISIRLVAIKLGLEVSGNSGRCWRGSQHQNGDRTPSLSFTKRNKAKCHVCDSQAMSVLDLIEGVRECDLRQAVEWVRDRFDVPVIEKARHVNRRGAKYQRTRALGLPLEVIVGSGFWASLSKAAKSLLVVFLTFSDSEDEWVIISFRALVRFAGLSNASIVRAQSELRKLGLLELYKSTQAAPLRECNRYRLNCESPVFLEYIAKLNEKNRSEVELERAFQKRRRQERSKTIHTLGNTLSTSKSTEQSHALISDARDCISTAPFSNEASRGESQ